MRIKDSVFRPPFSFFGVLHTSIPFLAWGTGYWKATHWLFVPSVLCKLSRDQGNIFNRNLDFDASQFQCLCLRASLKGNVHLHRLTQSVQVCKACWAHADYSFGGLKCFGAGVSLTWDKMFLDVFKGVSGLSASVCWPIFLHAISWCYTQVEDSSLLISPIML